MLFNSYEFLFAYLPLVLLGYFLAARQSARLGCWWLALSSLVFYAWWNYVFLPLLLASIAFNYLCGSFIGRRAGQSVAKRALLLAVAANLILLAYFKYLDFIIGSLNAGLGLNLPPQGLTLPIGISFFTFTQIAFLADAYGGTVSEYRPARYLLFVTYFPHLVAGPVLHHKEMMPQFELAQNCRPHAANFVLGLTIFAIGLAKKVLVADNLAGYASPGFTAGAVAPGLFAAWGTALAYTFQLYFDFSGYSDMAIGLSRLFGIQLPLNFNSPYRATNIAEFWRRWHMTLSRFLRDYLYIPLGGNRHGKLRQLRNLMLTMVLGGLWHGAGWNFVIWGALHGCYLILHQGWQSLWRRLRRHNAADAKPRPARWAGTSLTFVCVVFAWVYFRAPDLHTANQLILAMLGQHGAALPDSLFGRSGWIDGVLHRLAITSYAGGGEVFVGTWFWILAGAALAFLPPNSQELMRRFEQVVARSHPSETSSVAPQRSWVLHRRAAVVAGIMFAFGILALNRPTEFLYFQF